MPGEYSGRIGRDFLEKTCFFLDGKFGFLVYQNCYEGRNAASVLVNGERVRFDIIAYQTRTETHQSRGTTTHKVRFFCECKWRKNPKYLKYELKKFLKKALKTTPEIRGQYSDNFHFMFICNQPFSVNQQDLEDVEYLKKFLGSDYTTSNLAGLSRSIGILILADWWLKIASEG